MQATLTLEPGTYTLAYFSDGSHDCEGFNAPIPPSGYAWWYFDALSDDGQRAFTAILFWLVTRVFWKLP